MAATGELMRKSALSFELSCCRCLRWSRTFSNQSPLHGNIPSLILMAPAEPTTSAYYPLGHRIANVTPFKASALNDTTLTLWRLQKIPEKTYINCLVN